MAAHRVRALLDIIDQLPATSHTHAAIVSDPTQAQLIAATAEPPDPDEWAPRIEEWSITEELLAAIYDVLVAVNSNPDGKKPPRWPRPPSLVAELMRERADAARDAFIDNLTAGRIRTTE